MVQALLALSSFSIVATTSYLVERFTRAIYWNMIQRSITVIICTLNVLNVPRGTNQTWMNLRSISWVIPCYLDARTQNLCHILQHHCKIHCTHFPFSFITCQRGQLDWFCNKEKLGVRQHRDKIQQVRRAQTTLASNIFDWNTVIMHIHDAIIFNNMAYCNPSLEVFVYFPKFDWLSNRAIANCYTFYKVKINMHSAWLCMFT